MILPNKHLSQSRSLIGVGAEILAQLDEPRAVSELWDRVREARAAGPGLPPLSFDWFALALTFLYAIQGVILERGLVATRSRRP